MAQVEEIRDEVREAGALEAEARRARHAQRDTEPFEPGDLVIVIEEGKPPKLEAQWRGPFRVIERRGQASYQLSQLDRSRIQGGSRDQHEDHLKLFRPRTGYLESETDKRIPFAQLLRRGRRTAGLPQGRARL
ncbi:hypothetical protein G7046_g3395 [Stylonectria norvegica]|nr:hypothetical protein G7046_g3395 [Stylonectria norvegica]